MNTRRTMLSAALMAALGSGAWGLQAQETKPDTDRKEFRTKVEINDEKATSGRLGKFHKASKLVGMNVKNQADESLGEIKELVVDMESGRISYVVLGVGGLLGIGEKYVAVPPSAFNYSDSGNHLVLNADKSKVEQAPGFTRDNWPDVENPAWGAYWGARAGARDLDRLDRNTGRLPGERDIDLQNRQQDRLQQNRQDRPGFRAEGDVRTGQQFGQGETFSGEIVSINSQARTMTVKGESGTQVFTIDQSANLKLKNAPSGKLSDLKVGDRVNVKYRKQGDGAGMVHSIETSDRLLK